MAEAAKEIDYTGRIALITGITGQDGSYLSEFLLAKVSNAFMCVA